VDSQGLLRKSVDQCNFFAELELQYVGHGKYGCM
jgi:hypothetical protein